MRIRLQYILFMLLFVAVNTLCRVQHTQRVHALEACAECCLVQTLHAHSVVRAELLFAGSTTTDNTASGRFFAHSFFAPELACGLFAQNVDSKVATRVVSLFGHDVPACPVVAGGSLTHASGVGSRGVDYYVYTIGKIRI